MAIGHTKESLDRMTIDLALQMQDNLSNSVDNLSKKMNPVNANFQLLRQIFLLFVM